MRFDITIPKGHPRFPVRVVLNQKTFSIFDGPNADQITWSVSLIHIINIVNSKDDPKACFVVQTDDGQSATLCAMAGDMSGTLEEIKKSWMKDIYFFQHFVTTTHVTVKQTPGDIILQKELINHEMIVQDRDNTRTRITTIIHGMNSNLKSAEEIAFVKINKEVQYETRYENELRLAERSEEQGLADELAKAKEGENCIDRMIERKELAEEENQIKNEITKEIVDVQTDTQTIITQKRIIEARKMEILRKINSRRKRLARQ